MDCPAIPDRDLIAVVVHGPATNPLTRTLWDLGLRPRAGTSASTVWIPARPATREVQP